MNRILLIAKKEVKRRLFLSLAIGITFGFASALAGLTFFGESTLISFGTSLLILNFALFLLGADIIAEERSKDTLSFLLTLPLRDIEIVLGKLLGLMMMIAPAILVNVILTSSRGIYLGFNLDYFLSLSLYLLFSASILLFVSSQFQRLPAIFLVFLFYNIILNIPGAFWLSRTVITPEPAPLFPVFLIVFSFLTPLLFGIVEYISLKMPFLAPQILQAGGPGTMIIILKRLPEDLSFSIVNLFSPLWHSSLLLLKKSRFFDVFDLSTPVAVSSIILTVVIIVLLITYQLRRGTKRGLPLFLIVALLPTIFGLVAPPHKIDLAKEMEELQNSHTLAIVKPEGEDILRELGINASVKYQADEKICELQRKAANAFLSGDKERALTFLEEHRKLAEQRNFTQALKLIDEIAKALERDEIDRVSTLGPLLEEMYMGC